MFQLDLKTPLQKKTYAWYGKYGQEPMDGELIEPRSEPTIISINGYTIKLSSKYVSLYT